MCKKTAVIVGAGSFCGMSVKPQNGDLIIAADGGYDSLKQCSVEPDILLGDFDSLQKIPDCSQIRHPAVKGDSDMALACNYAVEHGCRKLILYGGLGGARLEHTIANLQLLTGLSRHGIEAYLIGQDSILTSVTDGEVIFAESASGMLSVFCLGEPASGVWMRGLKYTLSDAVMTCDVTMGLSNEFAGQEACVQVKDGTLLLVWREKNGLPAGWNSAREEKERSGRGLLSDNIWEYHSQEEKMLR